MAGVMRHLFQVSMLGRGNLAGQATMSRALFGLALTGLIGVAGQSATAERVPLLMEGKTSLYQKVLVRPGASIHAEPNGSEQSNLTAFSVHFVYDRKSVNGERWVEIGIDRQGKVVGWMPEAKAIDWKHSLTASFTNPAGRQRTLLMNSQESLEALLNSPDLLVEVESARANIDGGHPPQNPNIVSVEPENFIDFKSQFYLLPILEAEEIYPDSLDPLTLLKVASISAFEDPADPARTPKPKQKEFNAGLTFVIDATSSMEPYIQAVRAAVAQVHERISAAGMKGRLNYGLVAFRDSTDAVPGLEFVAKTFADPNTTNTADEFLEKIRSLKATVTSSSGFAEDSYKGLAHAATEINWSGFDGRHLILVTDASAREGFDPLSGSGLMTNEIRESLRSKGLYTYVMHLKTPAGKGDHQIAEQQYRNVSSFNDGSGRALYLEIESGDPSSFKAAVNRVSNDIITQLTKDRAYFVEQLKLAEEELAKAKSAEDKKLRQQELNAILVGLAIKLEYFGKQENTTVPKAFEAWVADKDFRDQSVPTLDIRLLLSKNQISDLREAMRRILEVANQGQLSTDDFFTQLQATAAAMGRSPDRIAQASTLGELGLVGEYLDDLPFRSQTMNISQEIWVQFTIGQQQEFIDGIESKLKLLELFHDNTDNWVLLSGRDDEGEAFYPVPLSALP